MWVSEFVAVVVWVRILACRDGTVFDGEHLSTNKEFGHLHRNKAGILENY